MKEEIILKDLPKNSLNNWYSQKGHWSKRNKMKDDYFWLIKAQTKKVFPKNGQYEADYEFHFRIKPLDASNCIGLCKMIEDVLFEDDKWDVVRKISLSSTKDKSDFVKITVTYLD